MILLKRGTWVLVADGDKALILVNEGGATHPNLTVQRKKTQENPPDREQSADRPGRMNDGPSVQRSAMDDTDWHELKKARFATDIASLVSKHAREGRLDSLVLVAAPQVLGEIREHLHKEVRDKVIAEIPKVLTNHPTEEIARRVVESLDEAN